MKVCWEYDGRLNTAIIDVISELPDGLILRTTENFKFNILVTGLTNRECRSLVYNLYDDDKFNFSRIEGAKISYLDKNTERIVDGLDGVIFEMNMNNVLSKMSG